VQDYKQWGKAVPLELEKAKKKKAFFGKLTCREFIIFFFN